MGTPSETSKADVEVEVKDPEDSKWYPAFVEQRLEDGSCVMSYMKGGFMYTSRVTNWRTRLRDASILLSDDSMTIGKDEDDFQPLVSIDTLKPGQQLAGVVTSITKGGSYMVEVGAEDQGCVSQHHTGGQSFDVGDSVVVYFMYSDNGLMRLKAKAPREGREKAGKMTKDNEGGAMAASGVRGTVVRLSDTAAIIDVGAGLHMTLLREYMEPPLTPDKRIGTALAVGQEIRVWKISKRTVTMRNRVRDGHLKPGDVVLGVVIQVGQSIAVDVGLAKVGNLVCLAGQRKLVRGERETFRIVNFTKQRPNLVLEGVEVKDGR